MVPRMLNPHEVSEVLGISYEAALAFIKYSGVDFLQIGRRYLVAEDKLTYFLLQKGQVVVDLKEDIYQ